jgi:Zn finger protein HypA/HybF involved in hydrogenase expression
MIYNNCIEPLKAFFNRRKLENRRSTMEAPKHHSLVCTNCQAHIGELKDVKHKSIHTSFFKAATGLNGEASIVEIAGRDSEQLCIDDRGSGLWDEEVGMVYKLVGCNKCKSVVGMRLVATTRVNIAVLDQIWLAGSLVNVSIMMNELSPTRNNAGLNQLKPNNTTNSVERTNIFPIQVLASRQGGGAITFPKLKIQNKSLDM